MVHTKIKKNKKNDLDLATSVASSQDLAAGVKVLGSLVV
jgi:hypothetical protein